MTKYTKTTGAHVTTNKPRATSKWEPYLSLNLLNTASAFFARSSLLKLTATNMADATKDARVRAAKAAIMPADVPARDRLTQMATMMKIHTAPKFSTSFSLAPFD